MTMSYPPMICMCPCHSPKGASSTYVAHNHPGMPCWCYQPQAPIVVVPPTFCPHCGKPLGGTD